MAEESKQPVRLAILASGSGSNAEAIMRHFVDHPDVEVAWVGSNRKQAGVLERAHGMGVPASAFSGKDAANGALLEELRERKIDWVALAGYLLMVPSDVVQAFEGRMVNIHPALLPDFGGPGMYGMNVHRAVKASGVERSGMTIHWVTEAYDEGAVVFQGEVELTAEDDADAIASKVLQLEHQYYPPVLEGLLVGWVERRSNGTKKS